MDRIVVSIALIYGLILWPGAIARTLSVTEPALNSTITVREDLQYAGAVSSLVFRGHEYVDSRNSGALLQVASSFDGLGVCYNPTEAGSLKSDPMWRTSKLLTAHVASNTLVSETNMGFWRNPNTYLSMIKMGFTSNSRKAPKPHCGSRPDVKTIANTRLTSGHLVKQRVVIGLPRYPNVINYEVTFIVPKPTSVRPGIIKNPAAFSGGVFEAPTGYAPADFSLAERFDPLTGASTAIVPSFNASRPGYEMEESNRPVIAFTTDGTNAIGAWSPHLPQPGWPNPNVGYGYGRFEPPYIDPPSTKWNCVYRVREVVPGNYAFGCLIVVGTLKEVEATMTKLAHDPSFEVHIKRL